ncbi:MAG: hypothetical protein EU530_03160 [Promethearchaeota archaeon]|nr:MAG: hypothetical protein EU530_03160 [Candidatus Lokiarchaeota archaeon]
MKLYVFETDKWMESDVIYPHDIALCLVPEKKKIYVWDGPRATSEKKTQAHEILDDVAGKYPLYSIIPVDGDTPPSITDCINTYVNTSFEEVEKIDRDPQYVVFFYMMLGLIVGLIVGYIMILRIIGWNKVPGQPLLIISTTGFANWVTQNIIVLIILASLFFVSLIFASLTQKIFLIITASVGVIVLTGTIFYFYLGIYLFDFKPGSPIGYYYLSIGAVVGFFFLNLLALLVIFTPMVISLWAIYTTTTPISWADWKEKRKKKAVVMKKFSVLDRESKFTELEQDLENETSEEQES